MGDVQDDRMRPGAPPFVGRGDPGAPSHVFPSVMLGALFPRHSRVPLLSSFWGSFSRVILRPQAEESVLFFVPASSVF